MDTVNDLVAKVLKERQEDEKRFHKERLARLYLERTELEIRMAVLNDIIKHIENFVSKNPHLQG
jgi:hypothetical protein